MFSRVFSRLKARSATFGVGHQELPLPLKLMLARFLLIIGALLGAIMVCSEIAMAWLEKAS